MPSYKLFYFPARGGTEPIRFVLAQAGVPYEDIRLPREKWLQEYKEDSPYGTMPFLEEDGERISGSFVILRYLGEKYGLAGSTPAENAKIASLADCLQDMKMDIVAFLREQDEAKKAALRKELKETKLPNRLKYINKQAEQFTDFFFGKLTWVDFCFYMATEFVLPGIPTALDDFPKLQAIMTKISELPNIKKWIAERPKTEF